MPAKAGKLRASQCLLSERSFTLTDADRLRSADMEKGEPVARLMDHELAGGRSSAGRRRGDRCATRTSGRLRGDGGPWDEAACRRTSHV
jgi:hypothetical protein